MEKRQQDIRKKARFIGLSDQSRLMEGDKEGGDRGLCQRYRPNRADNRQVDRSLIDDQSINRSSIGRLVDR